MLCSSLFVYPLKCVVYFLVFLVIILVFSLYMLFCIIITLYNLYKRAVILSYSPAKVTTVFMQRAVKNRAKILAKSKPRASSNCCASYFRAEFARNFQRSSNPFNIYFLFKIHNAEVEFLST